MSRILIIGFCFLLGFSLSQEDGGFVQQDAHEHGVALLNIAQDADSLFVEFISPSINIVGFEYQPTSAEDKALVDAAMIDLANGLSLFAPSSAANCELVHAEVESELAEDEHKDHSEDEHMHDEDEKHAEGEDPHMHDEGETHSEFHASYEFNCSNPNQLRDFNLTALFNSYPDIQDLDVQYALDKGQGASELSPDDTQLEF